MNTVCIIGNITNELELETIGKNETSVLHFTVAVAREYTNKDGERETDFIRCSAFGSNAEFIEKYFDKGRRIGIVGALRVDVKTDEDTGERTYFTSVSVSSASFCEKAKGYADEDEDEDEEPKKKKNTKKKK